MPALIGIGLLTGFLGGLLGVGGGFILMPLLILGARMRAHQASGTGLAALVVIASASGGVYYWGGGGGRQADARLALVLVAGGLVAVYAGVRVVNHVSERTLRRTVAGLLLLLGLRQLALSLHVLSFAGGALPPLAAGAHTAVVVVAGVVMGLSSGLIGIGGGMLGVAILTLALGVPQQLAQGTTLLAIVPISLVGAVTQHRCGNVLLVPAVVIGATGAGGGVAGALLALRLPGAVLVALFGALMVGMAARLWYHAGPAAWPVEGRVDG